MRIAVLAPAALLLLAGCSSSNNTSPSDASSPTDSGGNSDTGMTGGDSGSPGDASGNADAGQTCGNPPFVTIQITAEGLTAGGQQPVAGVTFTTPLCPGKSTVSAADGTITGQVSQGVAFYGRFQANNYVNTLGPEQLYTMDTTGVQVPLIPSLIVGAILPGFSAQSTAIFIEASSDLKADGGMPDAGDPCASLDGIVFTVPNQPNAKVTYYDTGSIPQPTTGTSTTTSGRASITGLAPNQLVTVTGTKTGCTVSLAEGVETGRAPLEAGYVTLMPAHVKD